VVARSTQQLVAGDRAACKRKQIHVPDAVDSVRRAATQIRDADAAVVQALGAVVLKSARVDGDVIAAAAVERVVAAAATQDIVAVVAA
jgi:hypothetical protein